MLVANTTLRNLVAGEGDKVNRTILSYPASGTYTPGSDITGTTLSASSEALSIGTWLASLVTIDDTEKRQSIISIGKHIAQRMMRDHNNRIEQAVLGQVTNASWSLDDGEPNIAVIKFGYMLEQLVKSLVRGLVPVKI